MTVEWRETIKCPSCNAKISTETDLDRWIRKNPRLDSRRDAIVISDGDKIIHRYKTPLVARELQYLMDLEIKTHFSKMPMSQDDTLNMASQMMRTHAKVRSSVSRKDVTVSYFGFHVLTMNNSDPTNSNVILWDGVNISADELTDLLRFDLDPFTLKPMDHEGNQLRYLDVE